MSPQPAPRPDPAVSPHSAAVLTPSECITLLGSSHVGRLGFVSDGWPTILPVNYVLDDHDIIIRTDSGAKFSALRHGAPVAFEVDAVDPVFRSGWSVVLHGNALEVDDEQELARVQTLPLRTWPAGEKPFWIRIVPVQVTGRRLPKAWTYPDSPER